MAVNKTGKKKSLFSWSLHLTAGDIKESNKTQNLWYNISSSALAKNKAGNEDEGGIL